MPQPATGFDLLWWIIGVEVPVIGGLFWLILKTRREVDEAVRQLRDSADQRERSLREALNAFKLDVAKHYASIDYLKEVEGRLTGHLLRIEAKLGLRDAPADGSHAGPGKEGL